jgi:hypothetical protein
MNDNIRHPDQTRSRLRTLVAAVEAEIAGLAVAPTSLSTSWAALVGQLALGPEPATRACPKCGELGMFAATLCGHCWTKLTPEA